MTSWTDASPVTWKALAGVAVILLFSSYHASPTRKAMSAIPTAGGKDVPLLSWWASVRFALASEKVLKEGYEKYKNRAFKIGFFHKWAVVVSGPVLIDELRRQPAEVMSLREATNAAASLEQSMGPDVAWDMYINDLALSLLTQNPEALFSELNAEVTHAFDEHIQFKDLKEGEEWLPVSVFKAFTKLNTSVALRAFVGLPLARSKEWIDLNTSLGQKFAIGTLIINMFPTSMQNFARNWLTPIPGIIKKAGDMLRPLVEERLQRLESADPDDARSGDDVLTRIVAHYRDADDGKHDLAERVALRLLVLDHVALSTTFITIVHVIYSLATNPDDVVQLRAEAEAVLAEHGCTKAAMKKLYKLDAYIKEVMRLHSGGISLQRVTKVPYTFSDGTFVPTGTLVTAAALEAHMNEKTYPKPEEFKPERFLNEFKSGSDDAYRIRQSLSTTSNDYLLFGHGRYACPGRFFASSMMKLTLVHLITHYDIKLEKGEDRPKDWVFVSAHVPNRKVNILFRKREN